ncbi:MULTISPECIES: TrbM/KikA/MpfK family conjugal transfer protein [Neisseria]|uniref:TrbM n=2 Tax=Neisseria TaxID=482 RepID=A0AB38DSH3_9NEIS|nr:MULTISPECIES: TrbM/KikA/MpfK family conjugal transfer protein [Neisseria]OSI10931.1 conjugal transfer protein TrbM [Neisseria zoodegmatis]PSJ81188.1 conjugal transfer protein TrbM [Neisseria iguanae]SNU80167.1 TrbM [Neisseria zoodegmatis]
MKRILTAVLTATVFFPLAAVAQNSLKEELLQGDEKLACEAILCLSSGTRPNECHPSLHRYFSIRHKKMHRTIEARRDFLNMCPSSSEKDMSGLTDALANGAGRCDAAELNRVMRRIVTVRECGNLKNNTFSSRRSGESFCQNVKKAIVLNAKPAYCTAYHQHGWTTAGENVRYIGDPKDGGRWVNQ